MSHCVKSLHIHTNEPAVTVFYCDGGWKTRKVSAKRHDRLSRFFRAVYNDHRPDRPFSAEHATLRYFNDRARIRRRSESERRFPA